MLREWIETLGAPRSQKRGDFSLQHLTRTKCVSFQREFRGVVSFLVLTVVARCTYSLRSSLRAAKVSAVFSAQVKFPKSDLQMLVPCGCPICAPDNAALQKSTKRRRKAADGGSNSSPAPADSSSAPEKQVRKKKPAPEKTAPVNARNASIREEQPHQEPEGYCGENDGGGEWLVVCGKKRPKPKEAWIGIKKLQFRLEDILAVRKQQAYAVTFSLNNWQATVVFRSGVAVP